MAASRTDGARVALIALAFVACGRRSLQDDGGTGGITLDGAIPGDDTRGATDVADLPDVPFPTADANCWKVVAESHYVAPEILVVQDRSISLDPTRWRNFLSAIAGVISTQSSLDDWGLYAFPQDGPACGAGTVSTAIDVPILPGNATHVIAHIAAAGTGASGTPTAAAIQTAAAHLLSLPDPNLKFLMLLTEGAPTCAGTIDALAADPARAQADAIAAIAAAEAAGVPTFVVAPSTTTAAADIEALNALAAGSRYARPPPGPSFHTELTIGDYLNLIVQTSTTCMISLGLTPPVPDVVTVTFNGATVPRDRSHRAGWDYSNSNATMIELYGTWCDMLSSLRDFSVAVYFGCPSPG